jgi:hypothetical protein
LYDEDIEYLDFAHAQLALSKDGDDLKARLVQRYPNYGGLASGFCSRPRLESRDESGGSQPFWCQAAGVLARQRFLDLAYTLFTL